ncbi:MAG: hypothetical protein WB565_10085 [Acidimicrobiales bacterium]
MAWASRCGIRVLSAEIDVVLGTGSGCIRRGPADQLDDIAIRLAGSLCEQLGGSGPCATGHSDRERALELALAQTGGDHEAADALLETIRADMAERLCDDFSDVDAIALALIERGRLTGDDVVCLVQSWTNRLRFPSTN